MSVVRTKLHVQQRHEGFLLAPWLLSCYLKTLYTELPVVAPWLPI